MGITATQLKNRRKYLGSSDTPIILGLSPFKVTPTDIYWSKVADTAEDEAEHLTMGNYQEEALLRYASDQLGYDIVRNQFRVAHAGDGAGLFASNHDALVRDHPEGIEAKYANAGMGADYGEEGTDQVPAHVTVQCQHQMYTSDLQRVWVPVALAGFALQYKLFCVGRDEELIGMIVDQGIGWWRQHVEKHLPPDGNDVPPETVLKAIYREPLSVVQLDDEALKLVGRFEQAKADAKAADEVKKNLYREVIHLLGDAEGGRLPDGGLITFKEQNSAPSTDTTRLKAEHPDLAAQYIRQGRHRTLRILKARKKGA